MGSTQFDIQPYAGALPITFGMLREQVHQILGRPESSHTIWDKSGITDHYARAGYNIGYDNSGAVNHLGFCPGAAAIAFRGSIIWTLDSQPDPNPHFLSLDPEPMETVGFWVFLRIGVTTTGYHDDDPSQQAITVFSHDYRDKWMSRAKPADTSRYRIIKQGDQT